MRTRTSRTEMSTDEGGDGRGGSARSALFRGMSSSGGGGPANATAKETYDEEALHLMESENEERIDELGHKIRRIKDVRPRPVRLFRGL